MTDNKDFNGFQAVSMGLSDPSALSKDGIGDDDFDIIDDPIDNDTDDDNDDNNDDIDDPSKGNLDNQDDQNDDDSDDNDDDNDDDNSDNNSNNNDNDDADDSVDDSSDNDLSEFEGEIAQHMQEKLWEKFDWNIEEDEKMESVDDLVDYLNKVVEENSTPSFASNEIEELNEFVNNGGNLQDFFQARFNGNLDVENVNLENKVNQELVVREYFRILGADEDKITKKIERYDETGALEDEATDALEYIKKYNKKNSEKLLEEQKKMQESAFKQQQKFYDDVTSNIKTSKDIMGIPLPLDKKEKDELLKYIFKTDRNGVTDFQKDYQNKSIDMTILTAAIAKYGDKLTKKIDKKSNTNTIKSIKDKYNNKGSRMKGGASANRGGSDSKSSILFDGRLSKPE